MATRIASVLLAVALAAGCAGDSGGTTTTPTPAATTTRLPAAPTTTVPAPIYPAAAAGTFPGDLQWGDTRRFFLVTIPEGYDPSAAWPLIVNLHSERETAAFHAEGTGMADRGAARGYLVVHPQAAGAEQAWDPSPGSEDRQFLNLLVSNLATSYHIDQIYLAGMSKGAGLAQWLSCDIEEIAGLAAISGWYPDAVDCAPGHPISILGAHSVLDDVTPIDGSPGATIAFDAWAAAWALLNGCDETPQTESTAQGETATWTGCNDGTVVAAYRLGSGGHSWWSIVHRSDGSIVDTTDLVLDFFDAVRGRRAGGS